MTYGHVCPGIIGLGVVGLFRCNGSGALGGAWRMEEKSNKVYRGCYCVFLDVYLTATVVLTWMSEYKTVCD